MIQQIYVLQSDGLYFRNIYKIFQSNHFVKNDEKVVTNDLFNEQNEKKEEEKEENDDEIFDDDFKDDEENDDELDDDEWEDDDDEWDDED